MPISVRRFTCRHCGKPITRVVSTADGRRYWMHREGVQGHEPEPEGEDNATTKATAKKPR